MTAALNGAGLAPETILLAGFAFAVAGALSMFFSSYLSRRSELDALRIDMERERMEIETEPDEEKEELVGLLRKEGYGQGEVEVIMKRLEKDKELWLREQLRHELHLHVDELEANPVSKPASAGISFFLFALLALAPYAAGVVGLWALAASASLSFGSLFVLGSKAFTLRHFVPKTGLESAGVGALAAAVLYALGLLISRV